MSLPFEQILVPTTSEEISTEILNLCTTAGLPVGSWQSGSVIRKMVDILSRAIADNSVEEVAITRGGFGDLTSAGWAPLFADAIYDVHAILSQPATGLVTITNTSPRTYQLKPGELIVAQSSSGEHPGVTYRNQAPITIPAATVDVGFGPGVLGNVAIKSDLTGSDADANPGDVTILVSSLTGVSCTNAKAVLGADDETTEALVLRCREKLASLSPLGPKDAYNYVATTPFSSFPARAGRVIPDASSPITRSKVTCNPNTGGLTVIIADAEGAPPIDDITLCQEAIDKWAVPNCDTATVVAATEHAIDITYTVYVTASDPPPDPDDIKATIEAALLQYFKGFPIGGILRPRDGKYFVFREALVHVIHDAVSSVVLVQMTVPPEGEPDGGIEMASDEAPVLGTLTATVVFV